MDLKDINNHFRDISIDLVLLRHWT